MKKYYKVALVGILGLATFLVAWAATSTPAQNETNATPTPKTSTLVMEKAQKFDEFRLDHFKVYAISHQAADYKVYLRGQFDGNEFKEAYLYRYTRFLNPVSKNNEGIINKFAHLNWYEIETKDEPTRKVSLYNQFGLQTIKIQRAVALLAPAEKRENGSQFPDKLDHFKVYEVVYAEPINRDVTLKDQFGFSQNWAYVARYFAVPVEKRHEDAYFPILNREDHIVFYAIEPKEIEEYRVTIDQFGDHEMKTRYCELLGVPTKKIAWEQ